MTPFDRLTEAVIQMIKTLEDDRVFFRLAAKPATHNLIIDLRIAATAVLIALDNDLRTTDDNVVPFERKTDAL